MPFITSGTPSEYRRSSFRSHFWRWGGLATTCSRAYVIQSGRKRASASTPNSGGGAAMFWSASDLAELWIAPERELVGAAGRTCSRARVIQSGRKRASASTPNLGDGAAIFGVLPACRSFGSRRSGNTRERLGKRVPEHASSKAVASASTPNLGGWSAMFRSAFGARRSGVPRLSNTSSTEVRPNRDASPLVPPILTAPDSNGSTPFTGRRGMRWVAG